MLKKSSMVKRSYYLPLSLSQEVAKKAAESGLSASDIVRLALAEYLKRK